MSIKSSMRYQCAVLGGLFLLHGYSAVAADTADLLLYNGKVLTVDKTFSIATAVAVKDGEIVAVGDDDLTRTYTAARSIDLQGRTMMPGFMDTHIHIHSLSPRAVDIEKAKSIAEIQDMVRAKAKALGKGQWITGYGWDEALLAETRNLSRADLDAAAPDNPVVLFRAGGHSIVGNSRALRIAGITRSSPQPQSGVIEFDEQGEPNGVIRERDDLFMRHVPKDTWAQLRQGYIDSLRSLLPLGITSIMSADGVLDDEPVGKGGVADGRPYPSYRRFREIYDQHGADLPRVALYIDYPGAERLRAYPHRTGYGDGRVRIGPIGESPIDGGFTGPSAWTLADYKSQPGFRGTTFLTEAQVIEMVNTSAELGWQMGLHTIGDAAIQQAVDVYSQALANSVGTRSDHRWFLDHFTVMPPAATMEKMAENGIMIAQQPNFTYNLEGRYAATLDDWRLRHNNAVGTPANKYGIFVALGSDNLPIDPRVGLYAAVTRKGMSGKVHGPEESVSIEQAIRMYTANGPYLTWEEKIKGTLEVGKLADMIVLDSDPLTIAADDLLKMQVDLTIIGGKVVYERKGADASGTPSGVSSR